jgi:hypothetical protein
MNDNNAILGPSSSPETNAITEALAKAQAEYPIVAYDSNNPHFKSKFASYAQCCDSLRGPLTKHGLALPDFRPGLVGGQWIVVGTLRHKGGQWISGVAPLLMPKGDMQAFGAAMTYAKRTLLMALVGGFSGEADDDGHSVSEQPAPRPEARDGKATAKHLGGRVQEGLGQGGGPSMSGYQRFICVGNLTKDVESRMVGESELAKFSVAVNGYKDSVEFFDCEFWKPGRVTQFLDRGVQVLVEGEIQTQQWEKDGERKSRKVVRVLRLQLLGQKKKESVEEEEFATDFR